MLGKGTAVMKRTPLYDIHRALNAKWTEFGGWAMPLQYSSIVAEHLAVRASVGLFDLSHMGEIEVRGEGAGRFLQKLSTNDSSRLKNGQAQYSLLCNETGGTVDDVLVYRFTDTRYMLVVNAANIAKDFAWMETHNDIGVNLADRSNDTVLIALQGPNAIEILNPLVPGADISEIPFFRFTESRIADIPALISRTGYTGEVGFELYVNAADGKELWHILYPAVTAAGGLPVGLGARDTLRLEAGLRLYGMDMDEQTTPLEAGLSRFVKLDKGEFIGSDALLAQKESGVARRLVGFQMRDRAVARAGYAVYQHGARIGTVTSGAPSPTLKCNIGFASITVSRDNRSNSIVARGPVPRARYKAIDIEIRGKLRPAEIVKVPFYRGE